ncbi:lysozyme inhibitor LprI family protein [Derxia gummosa]|uniref:Lysozyme inhibitor LprI family protein n=1 Tax=Derxia gummosa DSM 723 TaxID=1121388 RepID=A0A8B6XBZ3_9BURK|nr:lysozyme inhibitor LprI family protein [Derxia gummosa]
MTRLRAHFRRRIVRGAAVVALLVATVVVFAGPARDEFTGVLSSGKAGVTLTAPNGQLVVVPESEAQASRRIDACPERATCRIVGRIRTDGVVTAIERVDVIVAAPADEPSVARGSVPRPSFDCNKAGSDVEMMICLDPGLAEADVRLARAYRAARRDSAGDVESAQRSWLRRRNACRDKACLRAVYQARIAELELIPAGGDGAR